MDQCRSDRNRDGRTGSAVRASSGSSPSFRNAQYCCRPSRLRTRNDRATPRRISMPNARRAAVACTHALLNAVNVAAVRMAGCFIALVYMISGNRAVGYVRCWDTQVVPFFQLASTASRPVFTSRNNPERCQTGPVPVRSVRPRLRCGSAGLGRDSGRPRSSSGFS